MAASTAQTRPTSVVYYQAAQVDVLLQSRNEQGQRIFSKIWPGSHYQRIISQAWIQAVNIVSSPRGKFTLQHFVQEVMYGSEPNLTPWDVNISNQKEIFRTTNTFLEMLQTRRLKLGVMKTDDDPNPYSLAFHERWQWRCEPAGEDFPFEDQEIMVHQYHLDLMPTNVRNEDEYRRFVLLSFRITYGLVHEIFHVFMTYLGKGTEPANTPRRIGHEWGMRRQPYEPHGEAGEFGENGIFGGGLNWENFGYNDPEGGGLNYPYIVTEPDRAHRIKFDSMVRLISGFDPTFFYRTMIEWDPEFTGVIPIPYDDASERYAAAQLFDAMITMDGDSNPAEAVDNAEANRGDEQDSSAYSPQVIQLTGLRQQLISRRESFMKRIMLSDQQLPRRRKTTEAKTAEATFSSEQQGPDPTGTTTGEQQERQQPPPLPLQQQHDHHRHQQQQQQQQHPRFASTYNSQANPSDRRQHQQKQSGLPMRSAVIDRGCVITHNSPRSDTPAPRGEKRAADTTESIMTDRPNKRVNRLDITGRNQI